MAVPSTSRDEMLDAIRGVALVFMAVDHLPHNLAQYLTWRPLGFYSAALVFVALSGYVCGWSFSRTIAMRGFSVVLTNVARRVFCLVGVYYGLIAISAVACAVFHDNEWFARATLGYSIPMAAFRGLLLQKTFILPAVLKVYIFLLPLALIVLPLFRRGIERPVLLTSFAAWAFVQTDAGAWLRNSAASLSHFNVLAWQFLFVSGLWLGFRKQAGQQFAFLRSRTVWVVAVAGFVANVVLRRAHILFGTPKLSDWPAMDSDPLAWGALLSFAFTVLAYAVIPREIKQRTLRFALVQGFALLGRRSLWVYSIHVPAVYVAWAIARTTEPPLALQAALVAGMLALMYATALLAERHSVDAGQPITAPARRPSVVSSGQSACAPR